jgi:hypothetical protein
MELSSRHSHVSPVTGLLEAYIFSFTVFIHQRETFSSGLPAIAAGGQQY